MAKVKTLDQAPGPRPRFLLGELPEFSRSLPWEVCARYARRYGGLTRIRLLGKTIVVLNDAELIGEVLEGRPEDFYKVRPRAALLPIATESSAFVSPGGSHWQRRRQAHPFCHAAFDSWLRRRSEVFRHTVSERVERFISASVDGPIDGWQALQRLSFDAFSVANVGRELGDEAYGYFRALGDVADARMKWTLPIQPPLGLRARRALARWLALLQEILVADDQADRSRDDLVGFLLREGSELTIRQQAAELSNVYFGGCFSATSVLLAALYSLTRHPDERRAALEELGALRDREASALAGCRQLGDLLREAMRLYPPVPLFVRNVKPDRSVELGGYLLPPNTPIFISNYALHHSAEHWREPLRFDPSRWQDGVAEANPRGSGHFSPFGRGPRSCLGEAFAMSYLRMALGTILTESSFEVGAGQDFVPGLYHGVMVPVGLRARFSARPSPPT